MLLQDKIREYPFSNSEQAIADYILEKKEEIANMTISEIAADTYTAPSTFIRIAKKLGYQGWNEFKADFISEINYLNQNFQDIDANIPFLETDNIMTIASKIYKLEMESAKDTMDLLLHDPLQKAQRLISDSSNVYIFCIGSLNYIGQEFAYKLHRIGIHAVIDPIVDNMHYYANIMTKKDCAICISYSGETPTLLRSLKYLKKNQVPIIAITSVGGNTLSDCANVVLNIATREKAVSKISNFSSLYSITLILNILYSCVFAEHYRKNWDYKVNIAVKVEDDRTIHNALIKDEES